MKANELAKGSLVGRALRELEERFVTLKLPPGSQWTEASLSESLKIGRTPVREAIGRMAHDGLVTVVKRAGIVISEISIEEQLKVLDARRVLERLVSARAASRASDAERAVLRKMANGIESAGKEGDVLEYLRHHFQIKRFVAQAARNIYCERALRPLHTLSQRFYFAFHREFDNLPIVGPAHADLTRAIADGDDEKAARRCDLVADIAEDFTRDLLLRQSRRAA